jgi:phospholipase C
VRVRAGEQTSVAVSAEATQGWYDFSVEAGAFVARYAGRIETGAWSISDPAMDSGI